MDRLLDSPSLSAWEVGQQFSFIFILYSFLSQIGGSVGTWSGKHPLPVPYIRSRIQVCQCTMILIAWVLIVIALCKDCFF